MEWSEWAPVYAEILRDFGYPREADEDARDLLDALARSLRLATFDDVRRIVAGRDAVVLGAGASLARWLESPRVRDRVVLVADTAVAPALDAGIEPDIIVTDLDGDVPAQVQASARGVLTAVHAHGDNAGALAKWAPQFRGPVLPTTQAEPRGVVVNAGGFTDGDRAVHLAAHCGARTIALAGFDEEPGPYKPASPAKARKLQWMMRLVRRVQVPSTTE